MFLVYLPKIADRHTTIYGGKRRNVAEKENRVCQLAQRKYGTVQIKDFTYVLKYWKGVKGPKIVQNYANTTQMFYQLTF